MRSLEDEQRARSATESDFTVGDVFVVAARSMRDRFGTHLGFAMVFLGWMGVICCVLTAALMVFVLTSMRLDADHLDQQALHRPDAAEHLDLVDRLDVGGQSPHWNASRIAVLNANRTLSKKR